MFSKKRYAREYLAAIFREYLSMYDNDFLKKEYTEYTNDDGEFVLETLGYMCLKTIMTNEQCAGNFVEKLSEWSIDEKELDVERKHKKKRKRK